MNQKNHFCSLTFLLLFFSGAMAQTSSLVSIGNDGKLFYKPDAKGNIIPDFSGVGYMNGEVPIPDVPVVMVVNPVDGDNKINVQNAIDQVAAMPLQSNGLRGAILFKGGTYNMATSISVSASGIVLRGEGDQTVFKANGTSQYDLIKITGASGKSDLTTTQKQIADQYVPLGAKTVTVQSGHSFQVGDWVHVRREPNADWISMLGMDLLYLDPSGEATNWTASGYKISFERQVKAVNGNVITFDAPFVDLIDVKYAKGFVVKFTSARIKNCAVENMKIVSTYTAADDEAHAWIAININKAEHCWVRNVNCFYFGNTAVNVDGDAAFVTVDNCSMIDPMSITTGGRKYSFNVDGNRNLVQNCVSRGGRHDFVNGSRTPGPNVFYNCVATQSTSESGPHHRWSTGILYDNVHTNNTIAAKNREYSGSGHGWAGSQIMMWNCKAGRVIVEDPQGDHINWAIGCIAPNVGDEGQDPVGIVESKNVHVVPVPSLYLAQLNERIGVNRQAQTIAFSDFAVKSIDDADNLPGATASSGLEVEYSSSNLEVATIVGGKIHLVGEGSAIITAKQAGNSMFNPAPFVYQDLRVLGKVGPMPELVWSYDGPRRFDGNPATDYVEGVMSTSAQLTISFVMTADKLANMGVVDKIPNDNSGVGWSVKLRDSGDLWFRVGSEKNKTDALLSGAYSPNTRVHMVCTFASGTAKIYVNGVLKSTKSGISQNVYDNTIPLRLAIPSTTSTSNIFTGILEQVKIYNQALTDAQIMGLFQQALTSSVLPLQGENASFLQVLPTTLFQSAMVKYTLSEASNPMLTIYSIDGKRIRQIKPGFQQAGNHSITIHREDLPTGAYIIKLVSAQNQDSTKFIVK